MNFKIILFFLIVLASTNLYSQINIEVNNSASNQNFLIEINENAQKYFITTKFLDSISKNKHYENEIEILKQEYSSLQNKSIKNDSVKSILEKIKLLKEKNSYYTTYKTEVIKTDFEKFHNLVKLFNTKTSNFFDKQQENKNSIVLDGTLVKIDVHINEEVKTISTYSPDSKSHPEIKDLLTSSLDLLRNKGILSKDKRITIGY